MDNDIVSAEFLLNQLTICIFLNMNRETLKIYHQENWIQFSKSLPNNQHHLHDTWRNLSGLSAFCGFIIQYDPTMVCHSIACIRMMLIDVISCVIDKFVAHLHIINEYYWIGFNGLSVEQPPNSFELVSIVFIDNRRIYDSVYNFVLSSILSYSHVIRFFCFNYSVYHSWESSFVKLNWKWSFDWNVLFNFRYCCCDWRKHPNNWIFPSASHRFNSIEFVTMRALSTSASSHASLVSEWK